MPRIRTRMIAFLKPSKSLVWDVANGKIMLVIPIPANAVNTPKLLRLMTTRMIPRIPGTIRPRKKMQKVSFCEFKKSTGFLYMI